MCNTNRRTSSLRLHAPFQTETFNIVQLSTEKLLNTLHYKLHFMKTAGKIVLFFLSFCLIKICLLYIQLLTVKL